MTSEEMTVLCRYIKAQCPQQAFDTRTPTAWAETAPGWLTLDAARAAVIAVKQRQPFVDISDIITEVRQARGGDRLASPCRSRDCRSCVWSWCECGCHGPRRRAVGDGNGRLAIESGPQPFGGPP